jgi:integrase
VLLVVIIAIFFRSRTGIAFPEIIMVPVRAFDGDAERKLTTGVWTCSWHPRTRALFRDIVILMCATGMRNESELFRMRVENLDWQNRVIYVSPISSLTASSPERP